LAWRTAMYSRGIGIILAAGAALQVHFEKAPRARRELVTCDRRESVRADEPDAEGFYSKAPGGAWSAHAASRELCPIKLHARVHRAIAKSKRGLLPPWRAQRKNRCDAEHRRLVTSVLDVRLRKAVFRPREALRNQVTSIARHFGYRSSQSRCEIPRRAATIFVRVCYALGVTRGKVGRKRPLRSAQLGLPFRTHGGRRAGAGRKPKNGRKAGVRMDRVRR
jgi:hypothetical protein